jgi:GDP-L-fucose synthase
MKIWVTGGAGSLGTALTQKLSDEFSGTTILAPSRNELDLEDSKAVTNFVEKNKPTHVFHLAAKVFGIGGHSANPSESLLKNTLIDFNVFSSLIQNAPQWIYYAGSVATYDHPYLRLPLREDDWSRGQFPHGSEFGYAMAKKHALSYMELLKSVHGTKFSYGLTTNLFGLRDKHLNQSGHVIISLLERGVIAQNQSLPLEVWGTGNASRDFLSVEDASLILCDLVDQDTGIVNIASGTEIYIKDVAKWVVEIMGLKEGLIFSNSMQGISNRWCDTTKLKLFSAHASRIDSIQSLKSLIIEFTQSRIGKT